MQDPVIGVAIRVQPDLNPFAQWNAVVFIVRASFVEAEVEKDRNVRYKRRTPQPWRPLTTGENGFPPGR